MAQATDITPLLSSDSERPATVAELVQSAENHNWDENGSLKYFLRIADRSRRAGGAAVEALDMETAFIMFRRTAMIVIERLPEHREYYTSLTNVQRHHLQTNGADVLEHLDQLKSILEDRYDEWTRTHSNGLDNELDIQQPNSPSNRDNHSVLLTEDFRESSTVQAPPSQSFTLPNCSICTEPLQSPFMTS
ncbi:hypothetical protein VKT23_016315 [Stygiomarasmius scandens]|uniref:USP8 dimerisation domain-containing protein n=1 Tax=Marasmiellus scandens TaxID=2682957 RepID=A0ABR1IZP6_9AGAR